MFRFCLELTASSLRLLSALGQIGNSPAPAEAKARSRGKGKAEPVEGRIIKRYLKSKELP